MDIGTRLFFTGIYLILLGFVIYHSYIMTRINQLGITRFVRYNTGDLFTQTLEGWYDFFMWQNGIIVVISATSLVGGWVGHAKWMALAIALIVASSFFNLLGLSNHKRALKQSRS